eukprot:g6692.t1
MAKVLAGNRRAEQARARDRAMVQMYNGCHAELALALANLRRLLRQCSINGTGWATAVAVSAALEKVGVSADSGAVLTLAAGQGHDAHHPGGFAQEQLLDGSATAVTSPETRLVHWPSIVNFLEDGLDGQADTCATTRGGRKKRQIICSNSPKKRNQSKTPRLVGEHARPTRHDSEKPVSRAGEPDDANVANPETTPESNAGSGDGFGSEGGAPGWQSETGDSRKGIMLVRQGLSTIDAGLRELEFGGAGLSRSQITDAMDSLRGILEAKAGVHCGREGDCWPVQSTKKPHDEETPPRIPEGTVNGCGLPEESSGRAQGLNGERLVEAACMAGKTGDTEALRDFADSVDLRTSDAFGRNALYYACLCGHVQAAHLVALRAYGGVEGIPENERWECRKNALSEELRRYLDTGILPRATPSQTSKSDERRPVQAVPAKGADCFIRRTTTTTITTTATSVQSRRGGEAAESATKLKGGPAADDDGTTGSGAHHHAAPPAEATISIASLFGWGRDREKDEDY